MEDERRRILEMVEKGRLSAQEANELLVALEEPEEERPLRPAEHQGESRCGRGEWGWVGETVGDVVGAVMRGLFRDRERRGRRRARGQE